MQKEAREEEVGETGLNRDGLVRFFCEASPSCILNKYSLAGKAPLACLRTKWRVETLGPDRLPNQTLSYRIGWGGCEAMDDYSALVELRLCILIVKRMNVPLKTFETTWQIVVVRVGENKTDTNTHPPITTTTKLSRIVEEINVPLKMFGKKWCPPVWKRYVFTI